jgi:hypothetical protein
MSWSEWTSTPWPEQRALLEGMSDDKEIPYEFQEIMPGFPDLPPGMKPKMERVEGVIDISAMREQLERDRRKSKQHPDRAGAGPGERVSDGL